MRDTGMTPVPGTGPYRIVRASRREIRFARNPLFREWSHAAQPAGNPDQIVWRFGLDRGAQVRAVQAGRADWMFDRIPVEQMTEVRNHAADRLRINDIPQTDFVQIDTRVRPFDDVRVRRALNFALDRRAVARLYGTREQASPSCQLLPPGLRAYHRYCPYTRDPRPDGTWSAPDLARARRLVAAAGATGARVTLWSFTDNPYPSADFWRPIARALNRIGLRLRVRAGGHDAYDRLSPRARAAIALTPTSWYTDYPSPADFYDTFIGCNASLAPGFYCDPGLERSMRRAHALENNDRQAADALWTRIDHSAVDHGAFVALANPRAVELLSTRLRNYQYSPVYGFLASQAGVR